MTQTGSTGVISAAFYAAAPLADKPMMMIFAPRGKGRQPPPSIAG
jgi:hypothetical protein